MNKLRLFAVLPIILLVALTGCDDKKTEPITPAPTMTVAETPTPIATTPPPAKQVSKPKATEATSAELQDVVKSYNEDVNASNDKARKVIDSYNHQIESVTGK